VSQWRYNNYIIIEMRNRRLIYTLLYAPVWDLIGWLAWSLIQPIFSQDTENIAKLNPLSHQIFDPPLHF